MKMRMTRDQMNLQVPAKVERLNALQHRENTPGSGILSLFFGCNGQLVGFW